MCIYICNIERWYSRETTFTLIYFARRLSVLLKVINPKTPKFYITPKIHKENNPARPVINSINCHTSESSRFVDHHFQRLIKKISSYIKDTNNFVNKINNFKVPENSVLVTMDVKALYIQIYQTTNVLLLSNENTTTAQ